MPVTEYRTDTGARWLEAGSGWPLLLLHAFPLNADMWRPQLDGVPDGWRFIAPDLVFEEGRGLDATAEHAFALLDHLHLDDVLVAGLSMGGYVAFAMHRMAAHRCTGFVLADTRPQPDTAEAREGRMRLQHQLELHGTTAVADALLPQLLSEHAGEPLRQEVRQMILGSDRRQLHAAIGALMERPDATSQLPAMIVPTLVVCGEDDAITPPALSREMAAALPRALLAIVPQAGHLSNLERPLDFSRALHDYLLAHI